MLFLLNDMVRLVYLHDSYLTCNTSEMHVKYELIYCIGLSILSNTQNDKLWNNVQTPSSETWPVFH